MQQLLAGERADPRPAQGVFLIPVALELVLRLLTGVGLDEYFVYGSVIAAVPTLGAVAIGRGVLSHRWTILLPVLDMVAIGVYRQTPGTAIGVAVVFPAIWLGLQFGRRGVVITTVMMGLVYVGPTFLQFGLTLEGASRISQMTLMAIISSAAVALTAELWKQQAADARTTAGRLELAMTDVIEQRRLTRTIVNGVDVGLAALDATGAYDTMNPRHQEFLDLAYPARHGGEHGEAGEVRFVFEADGSTPLSDEQMPTVRAVRGETFRDYLVWVGEDPLERRALAVSCTPYFRNDGDFAGAVLAYLDITDLVVASRIKDEFVASVSHELRTPLTSIIGYVDLILDDSEGLPRDVRDYLGTVQRNARRLHRLVDDLLSTALQSVATVLDVERLSVTELLERSALDAGKAASSAGLTFEVDTTVGPVEVNGDSERLSQVLDNLFSNAIKYTPAGGHVVGCVIREDGHAVIRVTDSGRGISEAELEKIFNKFFRSSTVMTDAIPGIGLGLAISKTIVDAHGGEISVHSRLGHGATFEVRLPLADANVVPSASVAV
jgi:signal transduction histidine kinase